MLPLGLKSEMNAEQTNPAQRSGRQAHRARRRVEFALIVTLVLVWIPGILQLAQVWRNVEYASHGFLIPFVALWAATAHRAELARLEPRPTRSGFAILTAVAIFYLVALSLGSSTLIGSAAVATVVAAVLALRGPAWLSTLRFPLAYLLFMIPLPVGWVTPLIVQLQLLVSSIAVETLQHGGVAIFREGNVLTLPGDVSLFVAEACSGITSVITLLPIGVFIAYFTESILWRRLVLIAAVIPIALAGNLLRVILTVLLSIHVDVEFATQGPLHDWAGVATYSVGCLCLLAVGALMRWIAPIEASGDVG